MRTKPMHPNAIQSIVTKLEYVAENLIFSSGHPQAGSKILGVGDSGPGFTYTSEGLQKQEEVVSTLLKNLQWSATLSERSLESRIVKVLQKALDARSTAPIREQFREHWCKKVENLLNWGSLSMCLSSVLRCT